MGFDRRGEQSCRNAATFSKNFGVIHGSRSSQPPALTPLILPSWQSREEERGERRRSPRREVRGSPRREVREDVMAPSGQCHWTGPYVDRLGRQIRRRLEGSLWHRKKH